MRKGHFYVYFNAAESRSALQKLARASNLLPRRKSPSSGEIASFPQVFCWRALLPTVTNPKPLGLQVQFRRVALIHQEDTSY
jgi:hypothetical protein